MSETPPVFAQINLIVADMGATLGFYRRLGLEIADGPEWPRGSGARHASVTTSNGMLVEFDNAAMAKIWHGGFEDAPVVGSRAVLGFSLPSREAVDSLYAALTATGAAGRQEPYDAFWGARYAVVQDPDGNDVGLMSPIDPKRRYAPKP